MSGNSETGLALIIIKIRISDINFLSMNRVHQNPGEKFKTQGKVTVNWAITTAFQPDIECFIVFQKLAGKPFIVL